MLIFETCLFSREYGISKDSKVLILYFDFCQDKDIAIFFFTASKFKYCGSGLKKDLVVVAVFDLVLVVI